MSEAKQRSGSGAIETNTAEDAEFRAEARAWLDANATLRRVDADEFKRRWAATKTDPVEERAHADLCKVWQRRIFDAGFAGIAVPREYGGRGGTRNQHRIWQQESRRYDIDTGLFSVGHGMVLPTILAHGTEWQKERFVRAMLRGDEVWCQLFSEPGAGSDLAGLTTRAERDGDEWVVNGQKVWNSYAHVADYGILLTRTNWDVPKHRGITYFLVDMHSTGLEVRPLRQMTGVAHFNETFLSGVRIPDAHVLGGVDNGWAVAQTTLMNERDLIGGAGGSGGGFRDLVEMASHFACAGDARIRQQLAASFTRTKILEFLGRRTRAALAAGKVPGPEVSVMKLAVSEHLALNGDLMMAMQGPHGMLYEGDAYEHGYWQQQFLGQWSVRLGGGTEQIQRNVLGERVLGLPPEPRPDKTEPFKDLPRN